MLLKDNHVFMGMQLDLSPTKHKPEFMYEAHNIRITSSDKEDTYLSLTNEKGTLEIQLSSSIQGYYLGHCAAILYNEEFHKNEDVIILFCTNPLDLTCPDSIYKIVLNDDAIKPLYTLYRGNLTFNLEHPIETFFISEAVDINKVYWNDGYNQPRVINLNNVKFSDSNDTLFDFVPTLDLNEIVTIERLLLGGSFSPGVIQYAFSYYNRWGQQSNIFYTSLLLYITFEDRGGSPDELVPNSFKITITNWLEGFDYIRVYSIHRTSIDAVPQCKIVLDIDLREVTGEEIVFIDNGLIGEFTDPAQFPYIGGQSVTALTWTQKDNTLFLGNIIINKPSISTIQTRTNISLCDDIKNTQLISTYKEIDISNNQQLNIGNYNLPGFQYREKYRFGIQAQYKDGSWSDPLWISDKTISQNPYYNSAEQTLYIPNIKCRPSDTILNKLLEKGYKKLRGLCVFPQRTEKEVVAQGIINSTLVTNLGKKSLKNLSSWFFRLDIPSTIDTPYPNYQEFQDVYDEFSLPTISKQYNIDYSVLSFHSPEFEFNSDFYFMDRDKLNLNLDGVVQFDDILVNRLLHTSSVPKIENGGENTKMDTDIVLGVPWWHDAIIEVYEDSEHLEKHEIIKEAPEVDYIVFPWLASGPLSTDIETGLVPATSVLKTKVISRLIDSNLNYDSLSSFNITKVFPVVSQKYINNLEEEINLIKSENEEDIKYQSNVDTVSMGSPIVYFAYNYKDYLNPSSPNFLKKYTALEDSAVHEHISSGRYHNDANLFGKNAFTTIKYKSSPHAVLYTYDKKLPILESTKIQPLPPFYFNDELINDVLYINVKNQTDIDLSVTIFGDTSSYEADWRFMLIESSDYLYNRTQRYISNPDLYANVNEYKGYPFLVIVDFAEYTYDYTLELINLISGGQVSDDIRDRGWRHQGKTYIGLARIHKFTNSNGEWIYLNIDYSLGNKPIINSEIIEVPTTIDNQRTRIKFTRETNRYWTLSNTQSSATTLGFKGDYTTKFTPGDYNDVNERKFEFGDFLFDFVLNSLNYDTLINNRYLLRVLDNIVNPNQESIADDFGDYPRLFLCSLTRDSQSINNKFGGDTKEALKSNSWIPAGESISIQDLLDDITKSVIFNHGDTWYLKYYCLKTYPYATTDENLIIEMCGFLCETNSNLIGVWDKSKPSATTFISRDSFNKFNSVYNLKDNFFTYRILEDDFYLRDNFPYSFFWTTEKVNTAEIDAYTNLNLVSSLDVSSTGGEITKLVTHNGSIYCFQPDGVNRILFNSRVLIPVSDGVPIEIANSAKLEGVSNITNTIGCGNKWSVVSTNVGLIFLDDRRKGMFIITDEGIPVNLSSKLNMSNWFSKHKFTPWKRDTSGNWVGTKICDDFVDNDIYLIGNYASLGDSALVYSKKLDLFTSFMSYNEVDSIFNTGDSLYAFKTFNTNSPAVKLYKMHEGNYNYFFDKYEPFDFTFISSGDPQNSGPQFDKTFTGVELRALFTGNSYFDYIQSKNDYQDTGVCPILKNSLAVNRHFSKGDTSKKFRIWRTDIPRVLGDNNRRTLNRVRNIWTKVKLGINRESAGNWKMELHDINVLYHI